MPDITPDTYPPGTRVIRTIGSSDTGDEYAQGVVLGWVGGSISVRWDVGGTSSAPAHFGGFRRIPDDETTELRADETGRLALWINQPEPDAHPFTADDIEMMGGDPGGRF